MSTTNDSTFPLPPGPGRLILCERTGRWAAALRREVAEAGVRVWETRLLDDCWEMLAAAPAAFLVLELTEKNVAALLGRLARLSRDFPQARAAVVADAPLTGYEWLMREAGAIHFVCSPRRLGPLAEVALRHLASVSPPQQTIVERIWASLPWEKGLRSSVFGNCQRPRPKT